MASIGGLLFLLGAISVVLNLLNTDRTLLLLAPLEPYQPWAGIIVALLGIALLYLAQRRKRDEPDAETVSATTRSYDATTGAPMAASTPPPTAGTTTTTVTTDTTTEATDRPMTQADDRPAMTTTTTSSTDRPSTLPADGTVSSPVGYGPPAESGAAPGTSTASGPGEATGRVHETSDDDTRR